MRRWAQMSDCPRTTQSQAFAPSSLDLQTLEAEPARRNALVRSQGATPQAHFSELLPPKLPGQARKRPRQHQGCSPRRAPVPGDL